MAEHGADERPAVAAGQCEAGGSGRRQLQKVVPHEWCRLNIQVAELAPVCLFVGARGRPVAA